MAALIRALVALFVAASLVACANDAGPLSVGIRLLSAPEDAPFDSGTALRLWIEQQGESGALDEQLVPIDERSGRLAPLDFGDGFVVRVEVFAGVLTEEGLVARGRSYPFDVGPDGPSSRPDVLVGRLGRFVSPLGLAVTLDHQVEGLFPTADGALLLTANGEIHRFVPHDDQGLSQLVPLEPEESLDGAEVVALDQGLLLAVKERSAWALDARGQVIAATTAEALPEARGAALVALPDQRAALSIGGTVAATPTTTVTRIELVEGGDGPALQVTAAEPLDHPISDARALAVPVDEGPCPCFRILLLGGRDLDGPSTTATVIGPDGGDSLSQVELGRDVDDAATVVLDQGLVLVAGGLDASGSAVTDEAWLLQFRDELRLRQANPLLTARAGAQALSFGPGLALIVGGEDEGGVPLPSADLLDVGLDNFPGDVVFTGELPEPMAAPAAAQLADGTILVADRAGLALYFPPRGPW